MKKTDRFRIDGKVAVITGGAGLLGTEHAKAIAQTGGIPLLWDIDAQAAKKQAAAIAKEFDVAAKGYGVDITNAKQIKNGLKNILKDYGRVDILINNAARDPKVDNSQNPAWSRLENFSMDFWDKDIAVGLTGAFLCSQVIGTHMAQHGGGVILNISSDLGLISPDQRIYKKNGLPKNQQPVKPVSYSVVKHGLIGLTKYLATYWAEDKIRVNAICPGGVYTNQPQEFVKKLASLIPLGRMAHQDEYQGAIQFLVSDASSYMTGSCLVVDGGRSVW